MGDSAMEIDGDGQRDFKERFSLILQYLKIQLKVKFTTSSQQTHRLSKFPSIERIIEKFSTIDVFFYFVVT